jgi:adenylate kinase family enzyme
VSGTTFVPPLRVRSTGLQLRRTEVGQLAEGIVANGGLLPDELMLRVVSSKLDTLRHKVRAR